MANRAPDRCSVCSRRPAPDKRLGEGRIIYLCAFHAQDLDDFGELTPHELEVYVSIGRNFGRVHAVS
jgi:hypothetical protein